MNSEENYLDNLLKSVTNPAPKDTKTKKTSTKKAEARPKAKPTAKEQVKEQVVVKSEPEVKESENKEELSIEEPSIEELSIDEIELDEPVVESEKTDVEKSDEVVSEIEDLNISEIEGSGIEYSNIEDFDVKEPDIEGLDEAIEAATETAMAAEFTVDQNLEDDMLEIADIVSDEEIPTASEATLDEEEPVEEVVALDEEEPVEEAVALDEEESPVEEAVALDEEEPTDDAATPNTEPLYEEVSPAEETVVVPDEQALDDESPAQYEEIVEEEAEPLDEKVVPLDMDSESEALDEEIKALDDDGILDAEEESAPVSSKDSLDDILNMLDDDDSELAEINDMLKKSDNNEPIQDDMMDLLDQMADDEANSVNAGQMETDDDDGGVPLPEYNSVVVSEDVKTDETASDSKKVSKKKASNDGAFVNNEGSALPYPLNMASKPAQEEAEEFEVEEEEVPEEPKKEKVKKEKAKKEKAKKEKVKKVNDDDPDKPKESKWVRFFNMLTEELVPEPTEEELAAEKEEKEAKKKENLTKKEQEKLAKAEAKKAKAEEKAAEKKAKAEEAAKKKKEKEAANAAKKEAKAAKKAEEAAANKGKKIPKKYIIAAAIFGVSVFIGLMLATTILSKQGYLRAARKAFYNQDYQSVYQDTYGIDLSNNESDGLIQAKSEVIMKIQRRYDSYQNNLKLGRQVEALDALIQGLATYDYINADAEQYGVASEVEAIKDEILNTLQAKYGIDETEARNIMNEEDSVAYTVALNNVINNK